MIAIYIMWLRQIKRFFRRKARIVGTLGQSLLFLVGLGFGLNPVFQAAGRGNYIQFLAPGIIAMNILFSSIFFGIEVIWDRQFGFLKETLVAPVPRWYIMLGRTLGGASIATVQGLIVFFISYLFGFRPVHLTAIFQALIAMALIALAFTSFGTAIASQLEDMQGFQLIMNFLVMPLFFLSGALFPLQGLPPVFKTVVQLNPLTYGVDAIRGSLIHVSSFSYSFDLLILSILTLGLLALGSYLFDRIQI